MIFARVEANVKRDEGLSLTAYPDTSKPPVWTYGYGCTHVGGIPVKEGDTCTEPFALELLHAQIFDACMEAEKFYPNLMKLTNVRQEVLVEMAYQLGLRGLSEFKQLKAALMSEDWAGAAAAMRDSLWHRQTTNRSEHLALLMEAG